jgi:AbrB family looped-hinge helix DNA binding protein
MDTTTISSKYQVVIPRKIRKLLNLKPGQKLAFIPYKNSMRLVIVPDMKAAYGFLEGIDTKVDREEDERV